MIFFLGFIQQFLDVLQDREREGERGKKGNKIFELQWKIPCIEQTKTELYACAIPCQTNGMLEMFIDLKWNQIK